MLRFVSRTPVAGFILSLPRLTLPALLFCGICAPALAQTIPLSGGTYSQDFDTLSNTVGSTNNTALPSGWLLNETGGGARDNEQYAVDTGSSNTGDTYSYGTAGSTDRAFGSVRSGTVITTTGACFNNATGNTLTRFDIAYTGEQWRLGTTSRTDALNFEYSLNATSLTTGTWTGVAALNFVTPSIFGNVGARDGNAAGNRTAISATVNSVSIANGANFCIRWNDADASGADDGLAIDNFSIAVNGTQTPAVSINDVAANETDSGNNAIFTFVLSLSRPAGPGGVTITYAVTDGTAIAGSDYINGSGTSTIAEGETSRAFAVFSIGDNTPEPDENFFVDITAITGASIADGQAVGTILNDDVNVVAISQIQGSGLTSPLNGTVVVTEGIVTAQKFNNGFFLQTADANADADPNTSEGIFVFTSTAPPATATVGNRIRVTGTVTEFTPSTNLNQLSITEIVSVTSIQVLSTGNPLPTPVALTDVDFNAASTPGTAEKFEGMRVSVTDARSITGADGNITESSATASTTGVFHIALPGVNRPFREPGIDILDQFPIPGGKTPPRFDHNAERIMVRSRGQIGATAIAVDTLTQVSMTGVMDYFSGAWAVLPDPGALTVSGGKTATAVSDASNADVTIGGFNLLRFFDEINDSNGAPTLTAAALDKRLTKTSLAICDFLKAPDILGVVEVENLRVLGLLADRINSTCARGPAYVPYLVQGNDVGGINVGFLVSTRAIGLVNRVEVLEVTQFGKNTVLNNPDSSTSLLNDRPPLMLRAIVHHQNGASYPVTVFVNHLRSLNGVGDSAPGSSGWPTENARVSAKRVQQAVFLASLVEARQQANPNERIVLLGDFNAFEFNDGYADVLGIIRGDEVPEAEVITYAASPITASLVDGAEFSFEPYSYIFDGNLQTLDHVLLNEATVLDASSIEVDHARINAEFGVHHFGTAGTALRVSDHDPVRLRITVPEFRSADLVAGANATAADVDLGNPARFSATVENIGPDDAGPASIALVFDALVTPTVTPSGLPPNDNWTCAAPVQNATSTTVTCTAPSLTASGPVGFEVELPTGIALANRSLRMDVAVASTTLDPANANNTASASVNVLAIANLSVDATGPVTPITVGSTATFTAQVSNSGPQAAPFASAAFVFDALVAPVVTAPAGWTCAGPVQNATTTTITCTHPSLANNATEHFSIAVPTNGPQQSDWTLRMAVAADSQWPDNNTGNNTAIAQAQVRVFINLGVFASTSTPTVRTGDTAVFSATPFNGGPMTPASAQFSLSFDALVTPVVTAPARWTCGAPSQTATTTTVLCSTSNLPQNIEEPFAISFVADGALGRRDVVLTAAMSSAVADPFPNNDQTTATVAIRERADIGIAASATPASVSVGGTATYTATVTNAGPSPLNFTHVTFDFNALVTPMLSVPANWVCGTPSQSAGSTSVLCSLTTIPLASGASVQLQASFIADATLAGRSVRMVASVVQPSVDDPNPLNDSASASVSVAAAGNANLSTGLLGGPTGPNGITSVGPIARGGNATFVVPVRNAGPNAAVQPTLVLTGDTALASSSIVIPAGWTCTSTGDTVSYRYDCSAGGALNNRVNVYFSLSVIAPNRAGNLTTTATVNSATPDPVMSNNTVTRGFVISP